MAENRAERRKLFGVPRFGSGQRGSWYTFAASRFASISASSWQRRWMSVTLLLKPLMLHTLMPE
jgi:hypothetical protein